tara:strand:+ start:542 stop:817 length:276 start_codon:yes stop_codon:yes gene_type:complete
MFGIEIDTTTIILIATLWFLIVWKINISHEKLEDKISNLELNLKHTNQNLIEKLEEIQSYVESLDTQTSNIEEKVSDIDYTLNPPKENLDF